MHRQVAGLLALPLIAASGACSSSDDDGATIILDTGDAAWVEAGDANERPEALEGGSGGQASAPDADVPDTSKTVSDAGDASAPCPSDMALVGQTCVDVYEAPNRSGALPLVMYSLLEGEAWCLEHGKRLCFDDEWTLACAGPAALAYPYGDAHEFGTCNDEEIWRVYNQTLLSQWPAGASGPTIESLDELLSVARSLGGSAAADHVAELYQAEPSGSNPSCMGASGVFDLCGNVEEWTRRHDGQPSFNGSLKGRYWAETRTCQHAVTTHGDAFHFYETGFRCCLDATLDQ